MVFGIVISGVSVVGGVMIQDTYSQTSCKIQNANAFEIDEGRYYVEIQILNDGQSDITNYDMMVGDSEVQRSNGISVGNVTTDEITLDTEYNHVIVTVFSLDSSYNCEGKIIL